MTLIQDGRKVTENGRKVTEVAEKVTDKFQKVPKRVFFDKNFKIFFLEFEEEVKIN